MRLRQFHETRRMFGQQGTLRGSEVSAEFQIFPRANHVFLFHKPFLLSVEALKAIACKALSSIRACRPRCSRK
jgi:hypothetical protein